MILRSTAILALVICTTELHAQQADSDGLQFFEKRIRPVLIKECYSCHSAKAKEIEGSLTLDTRAGSRKGGDRGPAVVPRNLRRSLLIKAIRHSDYDFRMPPEKKLSAEVIADFEKWVAMGAPDPRDGKAVVARSEVDLEAGRSHWAYQLPRKVQVPDVEDSRWPISDVDRFVLARLKSNGLKPVPVADRRTLLRRLTLDLIGLPPTPEELDAFDRDSSSGAIGTVVDRLLASPRFGEKWARHWLDIARYAESTGKTVNFYFPHAWRYRDYVIAAFNSDKPYDQFIKEQIAGDLMPSDDPQITAERMIATGFLALGPKTLNERNGLKYELDVVDEQIDVTTQAFLGITVACARCHDHKFDPIPQADYYAIAGIFRSTETRYGTVRYINAQRATQLLTLPAEAEVPLAVEALTELDRLRVEDQIQRVRDSMREMRDGVQRFFAFGRIALLQAQLDAFEEDGDPRRLAMGVRDKPAQLRFGSRFGGRRRSFGDYSYDGMRTIGDSPVFVRGEPDEPGETRIPRGTLQVMHAEPLGIPRGTSGRLQFAEWIASDSNPLTARVMVNRIWQQLFGRGLVPTGDFGMSGRPPSHPELFDHLALRFKNDGWSVKKFIRYLVTSRVYQLGSRTSTAAMEIDPDNVFLWRAAPRRLDAEQLRDAMLAVSGQLETKPPIGSAVARAGEGPVSSFGRSSALTTLNNPRDTHRSIYLPVIRDNLPESLALFDGADPSLITASREQTTVPSQGLFLLNSEFVIRASDAAADQLLEFDGVEQRTRMAFLRFYGRAPTEREGEAAKKFLARYRQQLSRQRSFGFRNEREIWSAFCQALFASADFQFRK